MDVTQHVYFLRSFSVSIKRSKIKIQFSLDADELDATNFLMPYTLADRSLHWIGRIPTLWLNN